VCPLPPEITGREAAFHSNSGCYWNFEMEFYILVITRTLGTFIQISLDSSKKLRQLFFARLFQYLSRPRAVNPFGLIRGEFMAQSVLTNMGCTGYIVLYGDSNHSLLRPFCVTVGRQWRALLATVLVYRKSGSMRFSSMNSSGFRFSLSLCKERDGNVFLRLAVKRHV